MSKEKIVRFSVSLPVSLVSAFDAIIKAKGGNRSKALSDLIAEKMVEERWHRPNQKSVAVIVMVYDHHKRELGEKLTHLQHHHYREILSNLHIHLDRDHCLEIIVVKGKAGALKDFAGHIFAERGVKFGKLLPAASGR